MGDVEADILPDMSDQNKVAAALIELLQRERRKNMSGDRLITDRPIMSRPPDASASGWEGAAALIGAALSPGSTIAEMVLGRPQEESLFDREIIGPDGKAYYPKVIEGAVPRMKKVQRKEITPNPIVAALQRQLKMGPKDPANDVLHQKINDRDFLIHATSPKYKDTIREASAVLPVGQQAPQEILDNPKIKQLIQSGYLKIYNNPNTGTIHLETPDTIRSIRVLKSKPEFVGVPGKEVIYGSPGVSTSRQLAAPGISGLNDYRFLLDPKAQKTFATQEPGFTKSGVSSAGKLHKMEDLFESEQRTLGQPYPLKPGNRAIFSDIFDNRTVPTEEYVKPESVKYYRATMGNETIATALERLKELVALHKLKSGKR